MKSAETIIGIPSPNEYTNNNDIPFNTVPETDAIIIADPKKAPTHGVKFIENITPKMKAENTPVIFLLFFPLPLKIRIFINSK